MAKPFDLDKLVSQKILSKAGTWYIIVKPEELPVHVLRHISAVQQISQGPTRFKFRDDTKSARELYKEIFGKTLPE